MNKNEEFGLLPRWKRLFEEYLKYYETVEIYTCDKENYTKKLGIKHHPCKILIDVKYLKAISYNIWLLLSIRIMTANVLRFFGSVYPLMFFFNLLNKTPKILSYQYDFYMKTYLDFGKFRGKIGYWAEKYSVKNVGNILTTTYELQAILKERYNLKSTVNPNFVNLEMFYPSDEEKNYIFFAGRIFHTKGIDLMIEVIQRLKHDGIYMDLLLAGDGNLDEYKEKVNKLEIESQITFLGPIPAEKVAEYMRHTKIFLFPTTTQEGHPKSLIEALASGAACVVSKVLGNTEVIQDGKNGLIVEPGNSDDLYEKVKQLLSNDELRQLIKKKAAISAKKYDLTEVVKYEISVLNTISA